MTLQGGKRKVAAVGNYRFTGKLLGKGNFAKVEEAVHSVLNVKVAIKIMDVNQIKEEYVIRNLYREAKIMSQLNHPCIAALFQTMQRSDNVYYLVTELVAGGDLCSFIKGQRNGKLDERSTKIYARQFVSALAHMHSMGIVHRDLKMENVMLNALQTQIKIVDFGLSNVWGPESPLRTHCGSPEYAAPELFVSGKEYGPEVDLWSLGIILYGMVVGQLPFVSARSEHISSQERRKKLVAQINKGLTTPHRRILSAQTPEFRSMMCKLLVADSAKRMSIGELLTHPWITDKGLKAIRINPFKKLDITAFTKICRDIGSLLDTDAEIIETTVSEEPLGRMGGMYNILSFRLINSELIGDGVARTVGNRPISVRRESASQRSPITNNPEHRKPATMSAPANKNLKVYTPRIDLKFKTNIAASSEQTRPKTAWQPQTTSNTASGNNRCLAIKRPAFSATTVGNRQNVTRQWSSLKYSQMSRPKSPVIHVSEAYRENELLVVGKKGINEVLNINRAIQKGKAKDEASVNKTHTLKMQLTTDKIRSKSDPVANLKRPKTTTGQSGERDRQSMSVFPAAQTQSASRTTYSAATRTILKYPRDSVSAKNPPPPVEKTRLAQGDYASKRPLSPAKGISKELRKPLIYDPIARSIADYLKNNVSDKIKQIRMPKNLQM